MIHVTAAFVAQAGKETQLHSVLTAMLEPTRNEQGCLRYVLLKDKTMPPNSFSKNYLLIKPLSISTATSHIFMPC